MKNYPSLIDKAEYICDSNVEIFKNRLHVKKGSASANNSTLTMKGWENVVAFEVYQDEKLLFASNKSVFTIDQTMNDKIKVFALSYDGDRTEVTF